MKIQDIYQLILFVLVLLAASYPLGLYINKLMNGEKVFLIPILSPLEKLIYKVTGININENQSWQKYTFDLIVFNLIIFLFTFFLLKFQNFLPLNPQNFPGLSNELSFNTAVSFLTNTNWQAYSGESTMSYFSQMVALTSHNFLSAATGFAACIAIIRGFCHSEAKGLGNFWVDLTRSILYLLLPLSFILALIRRPKCSCILKKIIYEKPIDLTIF